MIHSVTGIAIVMATIAVDNFGKVNDDVALVSDLAPVRTLEIANMKKGIDTKLSQCVVFFGLPIVLAGMGKWGAALIGCLLFFGIYCFLPISKSLRHAIKSLDAYVFISYILAFLGFFILYENGYTSSEGVWLYLFIAVVGIPVFKKLEQYLTKYP